MGDDAVIRDLVFNWSAAHNCQNFKQWKQLVERTESILLLVQLVNPNLVYMLMSMYLMTILGVFRDLQLSCVI